MIWVKLTLATGPWPKGHEMEAAEGYGEFLIRRGVAEQIPSPGPPAEAAPTVETAEAPEASEAAVMRTGKPKRKRGRPRKHPKPEPEGE